MPIKLKRGLFEGDHPLTQGFGQHPEWYAVFGMKGHNGIDYGLPEGTKLFSCISGTVTEKALDANGYGNYIKIENDYCGVLYGHMKSLSKLNVGDNVVAGGEIGLSGNTGNSTGPHLHFGVFPKPRDRENGYVGYIDPFDKSLVEWVDDFDVPVSTDEIDVLRKKLKDMEANKEEWKTKARGYEEDIKKLKTEIEQTNNTLKKTKELLESVLSTKQDDINKAIANMKEQYDEYALSLKEEIRRLQNKEYNLKEIVAIFRNFLVKKWENFVKRIRNEQKESI